jgi:hypothetical protein
MTHETTYTLLSNMWEKMQTARKPEKIVKEANTLISVYLSKNKSIAAHMWPFIDFFEQAESVLKTKNNQ